MAGGTELRRTEFRRGGNTTVDVEHANHSKIDQIRTEAHSREGPLRGRTMGRNIRTAAGPARHHCRESQQPVFLLPGVRRCHANPKPDDHAINYEDLQYNY